jgi:hypothetical protein
LSAVCVVDFMPPRWSKGRTVRLAANLGAVCASVARAVAQPARIERHFRRGGSVRG